MDVDPHLLMESAEALRARSRKLQHLPQQQQQQHLPQQQQQQEGGRRSPLMYSQGQEFGSRYDPLVSKAE